MPLRHSSVTFTLPGMRAGQWSTLEMANPRRPRDQLFRKSDLVRAIRAAQTAGVPNPRVTIDRFGTISIIPGETPPADIDDLDAWLARREKDARPA
jgi:hypothetical protein